ncbi:MULTISPECIES: hypothetical protein [Bacillaceae]|jgi:hypothetical protein|uniref:hypothetical protein n=1 Tax=Bacillaceae TaxID=186817 RepID=UPI00145D2A9D|nr:MULTISPECIES: hypothetical protein [Bacillaceae]MCM3571978.1 hypothetical protein [Mesobacillus subterraneus]NMD70614.1 hypothetical protein [Bacillus sp. DNRA2]
MVIQSNMSPKAIIDVWEITIPIFAKFNVPITDKALESNVDSEILLGLLAELNTAVGSSSVTCIEGG